MTSKKQQAVSLTDISGRSAIALLDEDTVNAIATRIKSEEASSLGVTSLSPQMSVIGPEIASHNVRRGDDDQVDFYLNGIGYNSFLSRIVSFEVLSDYVEVQKSGQVVLKQDKPSVSKDEVGKMTIVNMIDRFGNDHYVLVDNVDYEMLFANITPAGSSITRISSDNPSLFFRARALDWREGVTGAGPVSGVFFLTGTDFTLFMNNYASSRVIRSGVKIGPNGYIVGGKNE